VILRNWTANETKKEKEQDRRLEKGHKLISLGLGFIHDTVVVAHIMLHWAINGSMSTE